VREGRLVLLQGQPHRSGQGQYARLSAVQQGRLARDRGAGEGAAAALASARSRARRQYGLSRALGSGGRLTYPRSRRVRLTQPTVAGTAPVSAVGAQSAHGLCRKSSRGTPDAIQARARACTRAWCRCASPGCTRRSGALSPRRRPSAWALRQSSRPLRPSWRQRAGSSPALRGVALPIRCSKAQHVFGRIHSCARLRGPRMTHLPKKGAISVSALNLHWRTSRFSLLTCTRGR
jgi:hypothetical protein